MVMLVDVAVGVWSPALIGNELAEPLEDVARRGDKNHWLQDGLSFIEIQVICKRSPNDDGAHTSASVDRD